MSQLAKPKRPYQMLRNHYKMNRNKITATYLCLLLAFFAPSTVNAAACNAGLPAVDEFSIPRFLETINIDGVDTTLVGYPVTSGLDVIRIFPDYPATFNPVCAVNNENDFIGFEDIEIDFAFDRPVSEITFLVQGGGAAFTPDPEQLAFTSNTGGAITLAIDCSCGGPTSVSGNIVTQDYADVGATSGVSAVITVTSATPFTDLSLEDLTPSLSGWTVSIHEIIESPISPTIEANNDDFTDELIEQDTSTTASVLGNDDAEGLAATDALVTTPAVINDGGLTGVTFNSDGTLNIPLNTPTQWFTVTYEICLESNPAVCDQAELVINVSGTSCGTSAGLGDDLIVQCQGGDIKEYDAATNAWTELCPAVSATNSGIVKAPNGSLYMLEQSGAISEVNTTSCSVTLIGNAPAAFGPGYFSLGVLPDGSLLAGYLFDGNIYRMDVSDGSTTVFYSDPLFSGFASGMIYDVPTSSLQYYNSTLWISIPLDPTSFNTTGPAVTLSTVAAGGFLSGTGQNCNGNVFVTPQDVDVPALFNAATGGFTVLGGIASYSCPSTEIASGLTGTCDFGEEVMVCPTATDLVTTKVVDNPTPLEGSTITYTIEVTNNGPDNATGVTLTDVLPTGLTMTGSTQVGGTVNTYNGGTGLWDIGDLANLGVATLTITATVDAGQAGNTITNTITATASGNETDPTTVGDDLTEDIIVGAALDPCNSIAADGVADSNTPTFQWKVELYQGYFGVQNAPAPDNLDHFSSVGNTGAPILSEEAYTPLLLDNLSFTIPDTTPGTVNPFDIINSIFNSRADIIAGGYDIVAANGGWQMIFKRRADVATTINIGVAFTVVDDYAELFVNGVLVDDIIGYVFSLPAANVISYTTSPGDLIEIRLSSHEGLSGFTLDVEAPNLDTESDSIADMCDLDDDNDGILDVDEGLGDTDGDGIPDYLDLDTDGDGCPDSLEGDASFIYGSFTDSGISGGNSGAGFTGSYLNGIVDNLGNTVNTSGANLGVPTNTGAPQGVGASADPNVSLCYDYSDNPASYNASNPAIHKVDSAGLSIGICVDVEAGALPTADGKGDNDDLGAQITDIACNTLEDEDGVLFTYMSNTITADITVNNSTNDAARVCAYLDGGSGTVNINGTFERGTNVGEEEERCADIAANSGTTTQTLSWPFSIIANTTTYARVRLSSDAVFLSNTSPNPLGLYIGGEVEDYQLLLNPTAVTIGQVKLEALTLADLNALLALEQMDAAALLKLLAGFDVDLATSLEVTNVDALLKVLAQFFDPDGDGRVAVLRWDTLEERGTIGFYAKRASDNDDWALVNNNILPGLITAPMGGEYLLVDPVPQKGIRYQYLLIEQEASGNTREYGPYNVEMPR